MTPIVLHPAQFKAFKKAGYFTKRPVAGGCQFGKFPYREQQELHMSGLPYQAGCSRCDAVRAFWDRVDEKARGIPGGPTGWQMMVITLSAGECSTCPEHLNDESLGI